MFTSSKSKYQNLCKPNCKRIGTTVELHNLDFNKTLFGNE